jgi:hypothetical protein
MDSHIIREFLLKAATVRLFAESSKSSKVGRGVGIDNIVNCTKVYAMAALDIYRRKKESLAKS